MTYKPFDAEAYAISDKATKDFVLRFFLSCGLYEEQVPIHLQPEEYKNYDFYLVNKETGNKETFEVEQKLVWNKSGSWQGYDTIDIPTRKKDMKAAWFCMANKSLDTMVVMARSHIFSSPTYKKNTRHRSGETKNEEFFAVPINDRCHFFRVVEEGRVEKITAQGKILKVMEWKV
jgi:hypothetical protein